MQSVLGEVWRNMSTAERAPWKEQYGFLRAQFNAAEDRRKLGDVGGSATSSMYTGVSRPPSRQANVMCARIF